MRNFFVLPFHLTKFIPTHLLSKKFLGVRITLEHLIFFFGCNLYHKIFDIPLPIYTYKSLNLQMDLVRKKFSAGTEFQFFFSVHMLPSTMTQKKIINATYLNCDIYCIAFD